MECGALSYANGDCSEAPPKFKVVYRTSGGDVTDEHAACFKHGLAEVDRHDRSGGMATATLEEVK